MCTQYIRTYRNVFYFTSVAGNINLKEWSPHSLRNAGLCEDHFDDISFTTNTKKRLKRSAIPIHFETEQIKKDKQMEIEEVVQTTDIGENANLDKQIIEQLPSRKYGPSNLFFDISAEKEDITEWIHIEPPTNERIIHNTNLATTTATTTTAAAATAAATTRRTKTTATAATRTTCKLNVTINKLKRENARLRNIIKCLKYRLYIRYKSKKSKGQKEKKKIIKELVNEQDLHPVAKAMVNLQLHTPHTIYTDEEKNLSRQLYYYSASAFCRLKKAGCNFPAQRTIRGWLVEYDIRPGFCNFIFNKLQEKITQLPTEERVCALKWDEMYIKSYEEYSSKLDEVEGLVDLGPLGRKSERAKRIFVFCLNSLNARHPWRQPIAYFLPEKCMKAVDIVTLLKECLDRLNETGADVQLLTCDQGTCNQSAYAQLGVQCNKPFFMYKNKKYYASFDFPHLIKRLASFLRTHRNIYCDGNIIASYLDFEMTWSIDNSTKGGSNLLSHITEAHIRPNCFEAMNVKRAFQLFSHTFAAAIKTAGHEQELNTSTWQATADFAERMNNIIDACNAYSLNVRFGGKRPLSRKNSDLEVLLENFIEWCTRWSKVPQEIIKVPCFNGFIITIKAILGIYKALVSQNETFELATGLCNQDSVEHLFSKLRQRGGFNPNPTARMIRLSIRHILSTGYIQSSEKGNVQCLETETLINPPSRLTKAIENSMNTSTVIPENDDDPDNDLLMEDTMAIEQYFDNENIENINEPCSSYNDNAITFFAGFVARRSVARSNCDKCRNYMMKTPMDKCAANEKYIEFREYPNVDEDAPTITKLVRPTALFTNVIKAQLLTFNRTWQNYWASSHILHDIVMECVQDTNRAHVTWFDLNDECYNHRMQALKYLITVKIYSRTRYNNRDAKKTNPHWRKIQKFSNK